MWNKGEDLPKIRYDNANLLLKLMNFIHLLHIYIVNMLGPVENQNFVRTGYPYNE